MSAGKFLRRVEKAGVAAARRHLFLCICPECCKVEDGERLWVRLRRSGSELMCTSAACPRICTGVPWWAACPDGVSYGEVTPERFNRM